MKYLREFGRSMRNEMLYIIAVADLRRKPNFGLIDCSLFLRQTQHELANDFNPLPVNTHIGITGT